MDSRIEPARGDVWLIDLNPTRGREQAGRRPALIVSVDEFNSGYAGLVVDQAARGGVEKKEFCQVRGRAIVRGRKALQTPRIGFTGYVDPGRRKAQDPARFIDSRY